MSVWNNPPNNTPDHNNPEDGICCFCQGPCNPCSQSCGCCIRQINTSLFSDQSHPKLKYAGMDRSDIIEQLEKTERKMKKYKRKYKRLSRLDTSNRLK